MPTLATLKAVTDENRRRGDLGDGVEADRGWIKFPRWFSYWFKRLSA